MTFVIRENKLFWLNWLAAILILVVSGYFYRVLTDKFEKQLANSVSLEVPLKNFPFAVNGWEGEDSPLPEGIIAAAGNDDHLNRIYRHREGNKSANLYVAFSGRPRNMLGHQPEICYPANGWVHVESYPLQIGLETGEELPCLVHKFDKGSGRGIYVLNFYIINGIASNDDEGFSGLNWRTPNIDGDLANYVSQIQISSRYENSVITAAEDFGDSLLVFFRQQIGKKFDDDAFKKLSSLN